MARSPVDGSGRSVFNDLVFRRRDCVFFAFDLLFLNGEDLQELPLIERKARLKQLLRRKQSPALYVDHRSAWPGVLREGLRTRPGGHRGEAEDRAYRATEKPSPYWIKIKNPRYSQAEGRNELFNPQPDGITKV
jgi:hypothetical protein